jgi:hypothetical protein
MSSIRLDNDGSSVFNESNGGLRVIMAQGRLILTGRRPAMSLPSKVSWVGIVDKLGFTEFR